MQRLAIYYIQTKFKLLSFFSTKKAAQQAFDLFSTPNLLHPKTLRQIHNAEPIQVLLNIQPPHPIKSKPTKAITVRGYRWNHPGTKRILILHGFGSAAHKFEAYVEPLVAKGYEVIAFDAPAHGSSDGTRTNAVEYCSMVEQVMEQFGPIDGFIAHSFGALAVCLALEKIEHGPAIKLVLIAPATETSTAIDQAFSQLKISSKKIRIAFEKLIFDVSGKEANWFSIRRTMPFIQASVLWIHDLDDTITPVEDAMQVRSDQHKNVEFVFTKGLGHQRIYRDATVKKQVTDFL